MSDADGSGAAEQGGQAGDREVLPQGAEAPPPGVRAMAVVRWSIVALMAIAAAGAWIYTGGLGQGAVSKADARFHCPMHPSVVQDHGGDCPICGMSLVPVAAATTTSSAAPAEPSQPREPSPGGGGRDQEATPNTTTTATTTAAAQGAYWCPMHPEITSDDPQARCDKCGGMKLLPRKPAAQPVVAAREGVPGLVPVTLGPERVQLIGMRTSPVARRELAPELRTVGFVTADEGRIAVVNVRYSGYVKRVHASRSAARVRKGEVLATVYSPDLLQPQLGYIASVRWSRASGAVPGAVRATSQQSEDPRDRLLLLGLSPADLKEIEEKLEPIDPGIRSPIDGVVVKNAVLEGAAIQPGAELFQIADLSNVWVIAEIYEHEMDRVRVGQRARLKLAAFPGRTFTGRVDYLYPALNPGSRTMQARLVLKNPDLALRPGMYGDVTVELGRAEALAIPAEALVDTGELQYVFVAHPGGELEPRRVTVGVRVEDAVQVLSGLQEGETVVTTANFLVDSESRLRAALEGFTKRQDGGGGAEGHAATARDH